MIKPLNDYLIIEQATRQEPKDSIIIVEEKPQNKAKVLAVSDKVHKEFGINEWDTIYFSKYGTERLDIDWKETMFITSDELLAVDIVK